MMTRSPSLALTILLSIQFLAAAADQPNVIIILTDDQGYQDLGVFGAPNFNTPHIDGMANDGMRFTDFHVAAAVCSGSRAALMTGCYPLRVGVTGVLFARGSGGLAPSEVTIADMLKPAGYATALIGKWHLGHKPQFLPTKQGFDYYYGIPYSNSMGIDPEMALAKDIVWHKGENEASFRATKAGDGVGAPLFRGTEVIEYPCEQDSLTQRLTEEAVQFITASKDRPFFLYFAHAMPHFPVHASAEFQGSSKRGIYGDAMQEVDWSVGQVLDTLRELNLDRKTLVVFTSDNGPLATHGGHEVMPKGQKKGSAYPLRGKKGSSLEGGMRVPTVMWWPGKIPAGQECHHLATTMDLLPTVASITGADLPKNTIDGHNISDLLFGISSASSPYEYFFYQQNAVRKDHWKLIKKEKKMDPWGDSADVMLFNLQDDISEQHNLADQHPEIVSQLTQALDAHLARLGKGKRRSK